VLVWELTQACALACEHCRADARPDRHPDELTTAEGRRLLDQAREFDEDQLVVLSGGDPMARPDTVDLVRYGTDVGLNVTLTPSGTRSLTRGDVEALADARAGRARLREEVETLMDETDVDVWIAPAAPGPAPEGIDSTGDPAMNAPWTYAGLPAVSLPAGTVDGLPIGLQCVGAGGEDERLLAWSADIAAGLDNGN